MSMKLSVEAALKLLESMTAPDVFNINYELLFLLSCLPDGITREHVTLIWPNINSTEIENSIGHLQNMNLVYKNG